MDNEWKLKLFLECSVGIRLLEMAKLPVEQIWRRFYERQEYLVEQIAAHGDVLQFGGKGCDEAANALAEALSYMAHCPGGVKFAGLQWVARPVVCPAFLGFRFEDRFIDDMRKVHG